MQWNIILVLLILAIIAFHCTEAADIYSRRETETDVKHRTSLGREELTNVFLEYELHGKAGTVGKKETQCISLGCPLVLIGNGVCDQECNIPECNYDMRECSAPGTTVANPAIWAGNWGSGTMGSGNSGSGMSGSGMSELSSPKVGWKEIQESNSEDLCRKSGCPAISNLGNSICDMLCNTTACSFDLGDCIQETEIVSSYMQLMENSVYKAVPPKYAQHRPKRRAIAMEQVLSDVDSNLAKSMINRMPLHRLTDAGTRRDGVRSFFQRALVRFTEGAKKFTNASQSLWKTPLSEEETLRRAIN